MIQTTVLLGMVVRVVLAKVSRPGVEWPPLSHTSRGHSEAVVSFESMTAPAIEIDVYTDVA